MKLNRELQLAVLNRLADAPYPADVIFSEQESRDPELIATLCYLEGHGLVSCEKAGEVNGLPWIPFAKITPAGLDFLADDGGLSAILGTVTVRLHADTVRDLLAARIAASDLSPDDKKTLSDHLRSLPAEALKNITTRLLDAALDHLPDAIPMLQRLLCS